MRAPKPVLGLKIRCGYCGRLFIRRAWNQRNCPAHNITKLRRSGQAHEREKRKLGNTAWTFKAIRDIFRGRVRSERPIYDTYIHSRPSKKPKHG